jgi:hypothetical protein
MLSFLEEVLDFKRGKCIETIVDFNGQRLSHHVQ